LVITFIPAIAAVLTPLVYGWWQVNYAKANFGPAVVQRWSWPWFALATVALIPLLSLSLSRIRRAHRVIKVHQNGLQIRATQGKKWMFLWDEIEGIAATSWEDIFLGVRLRQRQQVILYPAIEKPIRLDPHLPQLDELATRIKAKIYPRLLPQLRAVFEAHRNLHFGEVRINTQGIKLKEVDYAWVAVKRVNLQQGYLVVEFINHKAEKISVDKVPNIELLIQLLEEGVEA
jgi:hypothetical protein